MNYKVIRRSNGVCYRIKIEHNGEIVVSVPLKASDYQIKSFVESHKTWIKEHYLNAVDVTIIESLYEGSTIYVLGRPYVVRTVYSLNERVIIEDGFLSFYTTSDSLEYKTKVYNSFMTELLHKEVDESLTRYKGLCGITAKTIKIEYKKMKRSHGRCYYNDDRIVFNPAIIHKTKHFIDAVVLHELAHFKYPNHQKEFYSYIYSIMPEYDKYIKLYKE